MSECVLTDYINTALYLRFPSLWYRISSKDSATQQLVTKMHTKPPNFGKRFNSSS